MKERMDYYKYYEKLMKMNLTQSILKTSEYHTLYGIYPGIAESIKLKRQRIRLLNKLKSEKTESKKIKIKREISTIQMKLKKNSLSKRLHGENKQEAIFKRKMKQGSSRRFFSKFAKKYNLTFGKSIKNFRKKMRDSLPPSVLYLKELDVTEKGLALSEWIREKNKNS